MTSPQRILRDRLRDLWGRLRQLSQDDAYERYVAHHAAQHAGSEPLSAREFYLREQQRKWSGVSRCC
jgi:uncharacterized short protein YbdD (DUF466 family)